MKAAKEHETYDVYGTRCHHNPNPSLIYFPYNESKTLITSQILVRLAGANYVSNVVI